MKIKKANNILILILMRIVLTQPPARELEISRGPQTVFGELPTTVMPMSAV